MPELFIDRKIKQHKYRTNLEQSYVKMVQENNAFVASFFLMNEQNYLLRDHVKKCCIECRIFKADFFSTLSLNRGQNLDKM